MLIKRKPPLLPIALYTFCLNFVRQHLPTWLGPAAHDTVNEGHCAAIIMEGLIGVHPDDMNETLKRALDTALDIYKSSVSEPMRLPGQDQLQASITIARITCNVLYMQNPQKHKLFKKKSGGS